jgi:hypothetical protein
MAIIALVRARFHWKPAWNGSCPDMASTRRTGGLFGLSRRSGGSIAEVAFRLIVAEAPDLTIVRVVGRLRDEAVAVLGDTCGGARRPIVLDLSELTGASDAGVLLLGRLAGEGVHLLGASHYMRLLLERASAPAAPRRRRGRRPASHPPAR